MPNINKVVYGNNTIIDLTSDTITPSDVLNSKSFHDASGTLRTGSADISGKADKVSGATNGDLAGLDANGNLTDSGILASNVIVKSNTAGLVKNDGTIDTVAKASQASVSAILNGTNLDSFGDVETALEDYFPRSEQAVLGAKNLANIPSDAVTYHKTDSRTHTYYFNNIGIGEYIISFDISDSANISKPFGMQIGHANLYIPTINIDATNGHHEVSFEVDSTEAYIDRIYTYLSSEDVSSATCKVSNIMIRLATDTDSTYAPYAMTNKELTDVKADKTELDGWSSQSQVSSGSITFTGIDDSNNNGYKLYINVDDNSTEKNPTAEITSISGAGTSSMSITFSTNADSGAYGKLRILK